MEEYDKKEYNKHVEIVLSKHGIRKIYKYKDDKKHNQYSIEKNEKKIEKNNIKSNENFEKFDIIDDKIE